MVLCRPALARESPSGDALQVSLSRIWALVAVVGCTDDRGPRLLSVMPEAARRGAMVTVTGERLCGEAGDCGSAAGEFQIGLDVPVIKANVLSLEEGRAVLEIPALAEVGRTEIVLTVNERASNALAFEVLP